MEVIYLSRIAAILFAVFAALGGAMSQPAGAAESNSSVIKQASEVLERVRVHDFEKNSGYTGVADLDDEAWKVRLLAIRDLIRIGPDGQEALIRGFKDENRHVRQVSIMTLGILGYKEAGKEVESVLKSDEDPIVRGQAAEALGEMAYAEAMLALKEAAEHDGSRHVKHRAELSLGRFLELEFSSLESIKAWSGLDENTFRQAKVGQPAPDFTLRDVNGTAWRLSDFKGKSTVVLIWIFADWCPVCQHEFGDLTTMEKQFKEAGVQAFTIECHDPYRCNSMVAGRDLWWPHLVDIAGAVGATYGVDPMEFIVHDEWINRPSTIIVDRDGVVRFAYYGTYWGDRPTIEQTLEMIKTSSYSFRHPERRGESN